MINIGPASSPALVFEAPFDGIYAFVLKGADLSSTIQFRVNGGLVSQQTVLQSSYPVPIEQSFQLYLLAGEELTYTGPAANLAGVRLGDEL